MTLICGRAGLNNSYLLARLCKSARFGSILLQSNVDISRERFLLQSLIFGFRLGFSFLFDSDTAMLKASVVIAVRISAIAKIVRFRLAFIHRRGHHFDQIGRTKIVYIVKKLLFCLLSFG